MKIIEIKGVSKSFQLADREIEVLKNVNLEIEKGEFISIMGPSGSGKSTLLYLMGGAGPDRRGVYTHQRDRNEQTGRYCREQDEKK